MLRSVARVGGHVAPPDTVVTVEGTATAPSGFFGKGFAIQDGGGAGIHVGVAVDLGVTPGPRSGFSSRFDTRHEIDRRGIP